MLKIGTEMSEEGKQKNEILQRIQKKLIQESVEENKQKTMS